ncbi:hypothetical protein E2F46_03030 [Luteimonas aestuarii]|uniref:Uncharacterized protein n=1 Tax=Luteimonas aestuarii TaxID=453837 RepID=A0A4R5U0U6_9GAMM|nr:hypothetical protein [Luteimonas aestuarii]TDK27196.1 hypothetical protein E2F46_03030 [Luteimonas aestuarii]
MRDDGTTQVVTSGGLRFDDAPVEARIGRHTYRIPAHYFYDQMGPTFQGDVSLRLQWPDLTPMPPGRTRESSFLERMAAVSYAIYYVDRLDIRESMRRGYSNAAMPKDTLDYRDPENRLDLRIPQPEAMGLIRYDLDPVLDADYARAWEAENGRPVKIRPGWRKDWYIAHDEMGEVVTFIKCDTDEISDGLIVRGRELLDNENPQDRRVARCAHFMILPEERLSVRISYVRVLLPEWNRIEGALKDILARTRLD